MTARVVLSQTAPWNTRLRNGYRTRWTQVAGRRFEVAARFLNDIWSIVEVDEAGQILITGWALGADGLRVPTIGYSDIAMTLAEARTKIAAEVGL